MLSFKLGRRTTDDGGRKRIQLIIVFDGNRVGSPPGSCGDKITGFGNTTQVRQ